MKQTIYLIPLLLAILTIILLFFYLQQRKLLYYPVTHKPQDILDLKQYEWAINHDQVKLGGWITKPLSSVTNTNPLILYYGGNAEDLAKLTKNIINGKDLVGTYLLLNYRGYGASTGETTEKNLVADASYVYQQLVRKYGIDPENIVLVGRSLGSGIAIQVAAQHQIRSMILITPYDSIANVAKHHYPWLPVNLLMKDQFNSVDYVNKLPKNMSILILKATTDKTVPHCHTNDLVKKLNQNQRVSMHTIIDSNHANITEKNDLWESIYKFVVSNHGICCM